MTSHHKPHTPQELADALAANKAHAEAEHKAAEDRRAAERRASEDRRADWKLMSPQECLANFGLKRSEIHHLSLNTFFIPAPLRKCYQDYFLLHWSGENLRERLHEGTLTTYGEKYNVIYKNCTPEKAKKSPTLRLSFRKAFKELAIPAYVLITCADAPLTEAQPTEESE